MRSSYIVRAAGFFVLLGFVCVVQAATWYQYSARHSTNLSLKRGIVVAKESDCQTIANKLGENITQASIARVTSSSGGSNTENASLVLTLRCSSPSAKFTLGSLEHCMTVEAFFTQGAVGSGISSAGVTTQIGNVCFDGVTGASSTAAVTDLFEEMPTAQVMAYCAFALMFGLGVLAGKGAG